MSSKNSKIKEVVGDYSVSSTRRMQAPGNIRSGHQIKGSHSSILNDEESQRVKILQDEESLPKSAVVLVVNDGKVLAVSRWNNYEDLNIPGGLVEIGEDPMDAATREVFEETGIKVSGLVPIYKEIQNGRLVHAYKATSFSGTLKGSEEGKPSWEKPSILLMGTFGNFFRRMIQNIPGDVIFQSL